MASKLLAFGVIWKVEQKIAFIIAAAIAALSFVSGACYYAVGDYSTVVSDRSDVEAAIGSLNRVLINVEDAETGQRGFLLTGNKSYLEPYYLGREGVSRDMKDMKRLAAKVANQDGITRLDLLIREKFAELQETIDLRNGPNGFDAALRVVTTDCGKKAMDEIREIIERLSAADLQVLKTTDEKTLNRSRSVLRDIVSASLLGIVITVICGIRICAEVRAKRHSRLRAEALAVSLEAKNKELEETVAKVKTLTGLLPLCAQCKKVRDDKGYWNQVEVYINSHSDAQVTHGICPDCAGEMMRTFHSETDRLRILLVEDNPLDAELIISAIPGNPECRRVVSEKEYLEALDFPDIILSDWTLPNFGGSAALQILQERNLPIPFIVVTGSIGEQAAVEVIRRGATDYIVKDRLSRLEEAIPRALNLCRLKEERGKLEKDLRESEVRFKRLAQFTPGGLFHTDLQGRCRFVNKRWCEITGLEAQNVLGRSWIEAVNEIDRGKVAGEWSRVVQMTGKFHILCGFSSIQRPHGTKTIVQAIPETNQAGKISGYAGVVLELA